MTLFYFAGFIESWGRGTIKIVEKCLKQGLPEPYFIEESGEMKVVFYKDKFTEEYLRKKGLNERQIKSVKYVKEKGKIKNKEYQKVSNISERTATQDLSSLVSKGIFKQIGTTGKGTEYILRRQKGAKEARKTPETSKRSNKGTIDMLISCAVMLSMVFEIMTIGVSGDINHNQTLKERKIE